MQKNNLHFSSKIEVRKSSIEGYGVFAKEDIQKGEVLEESPFIILPFYSLVSKNLFDILRLNNFLDPREKYINNLIKNLGFKDADDYYFKWTPKHQPDGEELIYTVLPLGFGPIYNTSNSTNNAEWRIENNYFVFSACKDIKKNEEICTFYGYFLDENGNKFECDDVFNLGLDCIDNKVGFKSIRFSSAKAHIESLSNPFFINLTHVFKQTKSTIFIKKITGTSAQNKNEFLIKIPEKVSLKDLFSKLKEIKNSSVFEIEFIFEYEDKETLQKKEASIIWRN